MRNDHKIVKLNYVLEHYNVTLNPRQFTHPFTFTMLRQIHINSHQFTKLSLEAYLKTGLKTSMPNIGLMTSLKRDLHCETIYSTIKNDIISLGLIIIYKIQINAPIYFNEEQISPGLQIQSISRHLNIIAIQSFSESKAFYLRMWIRWGLKST